MTFWTIAKNDLKLTIKDKMFFFWLLVFPLLFAVIFALAFPQSSPQTSQVTLNIIDNDKSFLSQALINELRGEKYVTQVIDDESARGTRALIIPKNFSKDILEGKKVELLIEKEEGSNIEASQAAFSNVLKAVIKILARIVAVVPEDEKDLQERYDENQLKRLITLRSEMAGKLQVIPAGFNHTIPAVAVMFLLFTVLMYGGIILLQERREGQLERTYLSPATFASIIGGKWLSRVILGMLQIVILFSIGKVLFKVYLGNSILALLCVSVFLCGTIAGMSILLGSFIRKEEILIVLNILLANLMAALGGCWFPLELIPPGIRKIGFFFPTGWTMDAYHKLIFFGYDFRSVLPHIGVLMVFTLIFLVLAIRFFKIRRA
jgi:ABC-type multidrug transport system permease subunit